jgi:AcrR family transcriptional regulator
VSRTVDPNRPSELLDNIVAYLLEHGISDLSLRPLAKAVGSSPRVLLYYFESSEKLVALALARLREHQHATYREMFNVETGSSADAYFAIWKHMTSPAYAPMFRLFFEVYGLALRDPRTYRAFLTSAVDDWLDFVDDPPSRKRYGREASRAFATVIVSGFRGFMLDYCASRDRKRVDRAVKLWISALDAIDANAQRSAVQ